jgi:hypothetical protein
VLPAYDDSVALDATEVGDGLIFALSLPVLETCPAPADAELRHPRLNRKVLFPQHNGCIYPRMIAG